jgi:cysteine desulfurase
MYFDYASTTPLDPRVLKAMKPYLSKKFANPSSSYKEGVEARKAMEEARRKVALLIQSKSEEIIFTGGGTEGNNIAILGTYYYHKNVLKKEKVHFVTTTIEHSSVLEIFRHLETIGAEVTYVAPEEDGIVDAKKVTKALIPETILVSVMYANNEIGTIQPVKDIGKACASKGIVFHIDACQAGSYVSLLVHDLYADLLTLDGSKIYGPKGSGILFRKKSLLLEPIIFGGGQEGSIRSGTENVASIIGFTEAFSIAQREKMKEAERVRGLRDFLLAELLDKAPQIKVNGDKEKRLPNNLNVCIPGLDAEYAVLRLDVLGFAVSSVTSCKNLSEDSSSYVIEELYKNDSCSRSSLRITLGRFTTKREVKRLIEAILTITSR